MEVVLRSKVRAGFMCDVASLATHIESGVTTALLRNIQTLVVAGQTKIVVLGRATRRLEQLVLVIGTVRIMASEAVTNRWLVHVAFNLGRVFIGMAAQAELRWSRRLQLDPGHILIHADFMTAQAAHLHGRMHRLPFCFLVMALEAGRRIGILV